MNILEIDEKIKKISNKELKQVNILYLMDLFENKLNFIYEPVDLLPFSSIIKKLNLPEEKKKSLIYFRNKIAHNIGSKKDLDEIKHELKSYFIPFILSISSDKDQMKPYEFEEKISNKLERFGNNLGYNVIKHKSISIDNVKKTRLDIDVIFESDRESIIFEIKASSKEKIIPVAIDQLKTRLNIYGSRYGVLILKNMFYEEHHEDDYKILIIGELVMHRLPDWINMIKIQN